LSFDFAAARLRSGRTDFPLQLRTVLTWTRYYPDCAPRLCGLIYRGLHLNEERRKVGRNKRSVSGIDHAGNGLWPYPSLRPRNGMSSRPNENRCSRRICLGSSARALLHLTYRCKCRHPTEISVPRVSARASRRPYLPPDRPSPVALQTKDTPCSRWL